MELCTTNHFKVGNFYDFHPDPIPDWYLHISYRQFRIVPYSHYWTRSGGGDVPEYVPSVCLICFRAFAIHIVSTRRMVPYWWWLSALPWYQSHCAESFLSISMSWRLYIPIRCGQIRWRYIAYPDRFRKSECHVRVYLIATNLPVNSPLAESPVRS